ncbi:MAG: hypothetical protein PHR79_00005 [Bacteroidales bacterium]|nr:hypothetical protein [Bacteroidales bacterium]
MKYTLTNPKIKYMRLFSAIFLFFVLCSGIKAQKLDQWVDIALVDTMHYGAFYSKNIPDLRYPPAQLFDANLSTCWVSRMPKDKTYPSIYILIPRNITSNFALNIFSGYGKSQSLFLKNARPEKIRISLNTGVVPDGYTSEWGVFGKILNSSDKQTFSLTDTYGVQQIDLQNLVAEFLPQHIRNLSIYKTLDKFPIYDTLVILKLEILSVFPGTSSEDVCISEIFFNDCFVSSKSCSPCGRAKNVYLNEEANTLLVDTDKKKANAIFVDNKSVLQIFEMTSDKRWAILLLTNPDPSNRAKAEYRVIDVLGEEDASKKIENVFPNYKVGDFVSFKEKDGRDHLVIQEKSGKKIYVELR